VILLGGYLVACGLLCVAGVLKALRPHDTVRALGLLAPRLPAGPVLVGARMVAAAEAVLGLAGLVSPGGLAGVLVGASYVVFAAVVVVARARGGVLATCGCFGSPDTPPTLLHAAVDLALGASALAVVAAGEARGVLTVLAHQPGAGIPLLALSALGGWAAFLAMVRLPRLEAARAMAAGTGAKPR
jgi:hypothetical protein